MTMQIYVYCREQCLELMYVDSQLQSYTKNHEPMNNKNYVKIHKGINNKIRVKVVNPDYKKVSVGHLDVRAVIINPMTREVVIDKYLTCVDKGFLYLEVLEGELKDISRGYYEMVIRGENQNSYEGSPGIAAYEGFYKDQAGSITFPVEITSEGDTRPTASIQTNVADWIPIQVNNQIRYVSPPLAANNTRNTLNTVHTFTIRGNCATGTLRLQGTLESNPTNDPNLWFDLNVLSGSNEIVLEDFSGIKAWSFSANLTYFRFVWEASQVSTGKLLKIEYRN